MRPLLFERFLLDSVSTLAHACSLVTYTCNVYIASLTALEIARSFQRKSQADGLQYLLLDYSQPIALASLQLYSMGQVRLNAATVL